MDIKNKGHAVRMPFGRLLFLFLSLGIFNGFGDSMRGFCEFLRERDDPFGDNLHRVIHIIHRYVQNVLPDLGTDLGPGECQERVRLDNKLPGDHDDHQDFDNLRKGRTVVVVAVVDEHNVYLPVRFNSKHPKDDFFLLTSLL